MSNSSRREFMAFRYPPMLPAAVTLLLSVAAAAAVPNPPAKICVDAVCAVGPTSASSSSQMKWHPGHYMGSAEVTRSFGNETASKRIEQSLVNAEGKISGWLGRYTWDILEPTQGKYDFSQIDTDIAALGPGKRMMISVGTGYIPSLHLPQYIVTDPTYGPSPVAGQYGYWTIFNGAGNQAATWRPAVMTRLIALYQALGARYDSNPRVEAIVDADETGMSLDSGSDYSASAFKAQYGALETALVAAWPMSNRVIEVNYVHDTIQDAADMVQTAYLNKVSMGGPDIFGYSFSNTQPNYIWGQGVFIGSSGTSPGTDYRGKMPILHEIQSPELTGGLGLYTAADIYQEADANLQVSHMVWTYVGGTGVGNWTGGSNSVLDTINANPVTHTACPALYGGRCNTQ
jgi:hypothetical protein